MSDQLVVAEKLNSYTLALTLNRPQRRNALSVDLMQQLCDAIEAASNDPQTRVIVLRGAGDVFCAGLDLKEAQDAGRGDSSAHLVAKTLLTVQGSPLVTIAAVHGAAMAGGAGLMSACDFAIAAEGTKIGYPEVRRGLVAALVYTFLARQLRERDIRELLLLAEPVSADRALQMGLLSRVVSKDRLLDESLKLAATIAQGAPGALAGTKRMLSESRPPSVADDVQRAVAAHLSARGDAEAAEGIAAFLEKRPPKWVPHA